MKEDVFEVLMYLFENYMIEDEEFQPDQETLAAELSMAGFENGEISKAFAWLENLADLCEANEQTDNDPVGATASLRHYSPAELTRLNSEARGLIMSLENAGVLDGPGRELVIDRLMALDLDEVDLDHVKWVIMMVLCNRPDRENTYAWAEDLVLDGIQAHLH